MFSADAADLLQRKKYGLNFANDIADFNFDEINGHRRWATGRRALPITEPNTETLFTLKFFSATAATLVKI